MITDFTALDIETTGLNPKTEKIIEVGAVKVRQGKVVARFERLVSPGRALEERITRLTGITDAMLQDAPLPEEVIPRLLAFIGEDCILGHSVLFDYSFVKKAAVNLQLVEYPFFHAVGIDTLKIARCLLPELESRSLPFLCQYYQIPHTAHRAVEDAQATVLLYDKLMESFPDKEAVFQSFPLLYQVKKEAPAGDRQKERLYKLIKKHKLVIDYEIDRLTKNEVSRLTDNIISKYGRL